MLFGDFVVSVHKQLDICHLDQCSVSINYHQVHWKSKHKAATAKFEDGSIGVIFSRLLTKKGTDMNDHECVRVLTCISPPSEKRRSQITSWPSCEPLTIVFWSKVVIRQEMLCDGGLLPHNMSGTTEDVDMLARTAANGTGQRHHAPYRVGTSYMVIIMCGNPCQIRRQNIRVCARAMTPEKKSK